MPDLLPTHPLSDAETRAWRAFVILWRIGLPKLDRTFRRHGLVHLEYGILAVLAEALDGMMTPSELSALAGVTSSRLSHRLKGMEAKGLVVRSTSPDDARSVHVRITSEGRSRMRAATEDHRRDIRELMFDPLSDQQVTALADALGTVASGLTDHPFLPASQPETR